LQTYVHCKSFDDQDFPLQLSDALREQFSQALAGFNVTSAQPVLEGRRLKRAAVAVTIVDLGHGAALAGMPQFKDWQSESAVILTRRAGTLRSHAGQWAFPGGRIDAGETAEQAALRELREEVSLRCDPQAILGRLDDVVTRSGYLMTPIVVWAGAGQELTPNPAEVGSVHRIPLREFLRPDAPILTHTTDSDNPELRMPVGDSWVAAPTASVLYQFRELCLMGRPTRVDRFEQPRFTWR